MLMKTFFSIVIPTKNRPVELTSILQNVINQSYTNYEIVIIDDSDFSSNKDIVSDFILKYHINKEKIKYIIGEKDGVTAARNMGVKISKGDYILFFDDDISLNNDCIELMANFIKNYPDLIGFQPKIISDDNSPEENNSSFKNALHKTLMISYYKKNFSKARRSGSFIYPEPLTKKIPVQRLSGCCCCYKRTIFNTVKFDTNLKRWGFSEDIDFSYRVFKKYPNRLYITPDITIIHKNSENTELPIKSIIYMRTIYWFYLFFKNNFNYSLLNLIAFLWAIEGEILINIGNLILKRKTRTEWYIIIYLINSQLYSFKNLKNIYSQKLDFFNKIFK
jgi:GT2 family glycosyltransferase